MLVPPKVVLLISTLLTKVSPKLFKQSHKTVSEDERDMPTVEELEEKATKRFQGRPPNFPEGRPYNCCESVLLTLAEYLGVESNLVPKVATCIGAGFSLNGLTCGTISGAAMAIGLKYGRASNVENPKIAWSKTDEFIEVFKKKWGAVTCRELTGLDVKTPEGMKKYLQSVHDYACTDRVRFAVRETIAMLEE
jgi:C_GCAxxG_C_C family probable redox protein